MLPVFRSLRVGAERDLPCCLMLYIDDALDPYTCNCFRLYWIWLWLGLFNKKAIKFGLPKGLNWGCLDWLNHWTFVLMIASVSGLRPCCHRQWWGLISLTHTCILQTHSPIQSLISSLSPISAHPTPHHIFQTIPTASPSSITFTSTRHFNPSPRPQLDILLITHIHTNSLAHLHSHTVWDTGSNMHMILPHRIH